MARRGATGIGNRIAPPRFLLFLVLLLAGSVGAGLASDWLHGIMIGFDAAALVFLLSCIPLLSDTSAEAMRGHAASNDANRILLLTLTVAVTGVVLVTVGTELMQSRDRSAGAIALIVGTLASSWLFTNAIYALHYAHMFYATDAKGGDCRGIEMPGT